MEERERILVVDDEKAICQNVAKILGKKDIEVVQAGSAREAFEELAKKSFSLLISDLVMPGQNGLELLKLVKKQWPLTKVLMMTAYASIDTAVKAIRLGALDYLPKPFTPDELRSLVDRALKGELLQAVPVENELETIDLIDTDIPFDRKEVEKAVGEDYAKLLGPSDMPVVEAQAPETLKDYCLVGERVCDIFKKLATTCKVGMKSKECPKTKAKGKKEEAKAPAFDAKRLIGIDLPFDYKEVEKITGPEYVQYLSQTGFSYVPYEELKARMTLEGVARQGIDRDIPFDRKEVERAAGEEYARIIGPSDMPVVEAQAPETLKDYCLVGEQVCDIFKKLGATCKAGMKSKECPRTKAKGKKEAAQAPVFDAKRLIGIDQPFEYQAVMEITGPDYVTYLYGDGMTSVPYETLKEKMASPQKPVTLKALPPTKDKAKGKGQLVLVIDDEVAVNNNVRKILTKKGFAVDQATTKEEALEKISEKAYRVVLLDLKMPGVKGLELLKAIRDMRPETMVVIITGYASIETAVESARMGAIDYIPKPFTPLELREATDRALKLAA